LAPHLQRTHGERYKRRRTEREKEGKVPKMFDLRTDSGTPRAWRMRPCHKEKKPFKKVQTRKRGGLESAAFGQKKHPRKEKKKKIWGEQEADQKKSSALGKNRTGRGGNGVRAHNRTHRALL